jgi:hypothetical protein
LIGSGRLPELYRWATRFPGGGFEACCGAGFVERVIEAKRSRNLL